MEGCKVFERVAMPVVVGPGGGSNDQSVDAVVCGLGEAMAL